MNFEPTAHGQIVFDRVGEFIAEQIEPAEAGYHDQVTELRSGGGDPWAPLPLLEDLRTKAREAGLWNLFLPKQHAGDYPARFRTLGGQALSNVDYAPIAELTGRSFLAPYAFNCNAPDSGNMEVLLQFGDQAQRAQWLEPLLAGSLRSAFAMTEPSVASSDATNMAASFVADGDEIIVNGRKWWTTGIGHPDCKLLIVMGISDPHADKRARHSMVIVPTDTPGVRIERLLPTMGRYDEPYGHGEVSFTDVRVPAGNMILGPGRGFEIAQGRLGPGRVHHCMRLIGMAERALELACRRGLHREAFGKKLVQLGGNRERIARHRIAIDSARLMVLNAAWKLDTVGVLGAFGEISQMKAHVPQVALDVIDFAIQIHGGEGLSDDVPLAAAWTAARALRLADGPDEVHLDVVGRIELAKYREQSR